MMRPFLWDPWRMADVDPRRPAVIAGADSCTFGELVTRADTLGQGLRALGVADDQVVSTDLPSGPKFFALTLAALKYGFGLLPVNDGLLDVPAGRRLIAQAGARMHVSDDPGVDVVSVSEQELHAAGRSERPRFRAGGAGRAGYLIFVTSGTTGFPTLVRRARPWYPYKGVAVVDRYAAGPAAGPHIMSNPTFHLGTVGPALYALQAGSTVVVQQEWSPGAFVELVDRCRADSAFISADRLVELVGYQRWGRHRPGAVFHGGSSCPPWVKRAAIDMMGPILHEYYGTSAAVISEISASDWLGRPGSVGRPLPGVKVEIMADGAAQPVGAVGEIVVRPRAIDRTGESTIHTGDLGYRDESGHLYVLGRITNRQDWPAARLEHAIRSVRGVFDCVVPGTESDPPTCHIEGDVRAAERIAAEARQSAARLGFPQVTIDIRAFGSFRRTPSGKIERRSLQ